MSYQKYVSVSSGISRNITKKYSTSFSMGILAFRPEYREPIYNIYGFVRIADEIVDSFHSFDKRGLLDKFRRDTFEAIEKGISTNPVLQSFQKVVNEYDIENELIEKFLYSMEMDLDKSDYDRAQYDNYVYGSAEVVGLMCLKVFCKDKPELYDELCYPAKMLGAAFQKVNFLRDIKSDLEERGRIYLPGVSDRMKISDKNKEKLEQEISREFSEALKGIRKLPMGVKLGVYSAYLYFYMLFRKIKRHSVKELMNRRIRISNLQKILLFFKSYIDVRITKLT